MATEVRHGPRPRFKVPLMRGSYAATIVGHYTETDGLAAAGVTTYRWNSRRDFKRRAELLALRSAFIGWFIETYVALGGTKAASVRELKNYPFHRVLRRLKSRERLDHAHRG